MQYCTDCYEKYYECVCHKHKRINVPDRKHKQNKSEINNLVQMKPTDLAKVKELRRKTGAGLLDCKKALAESNSFFEAIDLLSKWGHVKNNIPVNTRISTSVSIDKKAAAIVEVSYEPNDIVNYDSLVKFADELSISVSETGSDSLVLDGSLSADEQYNKFFKIKKTDYYKKHNDKTLLTTYNHTNNYICVLLETEVVSEDHFKSYPFKEFSFECALQIAAQNPLFINTIPDILVKSQLKVFEKQLAEKGKPISEWKPIIQKNFEDWKKDVLLMEQNFIKDNTKTFNSIKSEYEKKLGGNILINRFVRYELGN